MAWFAYFLPHCSSPSTSLIIHHPLFVDQIQGDAVAVFSNGTNWVIEDQFGLQMNPTPPVRDKQQDLINTVVFQPSPISLVATWSRNLKTTDTAQDNPILPGTWKNFNIAIE